jgi:ferric-chelate reductase [NAD(P)H]
MEKMDLKALYQLSYGVYVVTSHLKGKLNGQIANTVFQVCAEPPRLCASINKENLTHDCIVDSGVWAVSILDETTPFKFIGRFGFNCGRDLDKLSEVEHKIGVTGSPLVIENSLAVMEVSVKDSMDAGTHTLFIGDIVSAEVLKAGNPLTYKYYHEVIKGKTPEKAATFQKGS